MREVTISKDVVLGLESTFNQVVRVVNEEREKLCYKRRQKVNCCHVGSRIEEVFEVYLEQFVE